MNCSPDLTELHNVLHDGAADEREYRKLVESVKASTFTAFYTPPAIVNAIASSLGEHGVSPAVFSILHREPAILSRPSDRNATPHPATLPKLLPMKRICLPAASSLGSIPKHRVNIKGFEELPPHRNGYFDVVSSNIPFGDIRVFDPSFDNGTARRFALNSLHNYFFAKGWMPSVREASSPSSPHRG